MSQSISNRLAIVLALLIVGLIVYGAHRNLYRILLGRTVVLVSVLYWYLLEAIRLPEALENYTQGEYTFGLFCVVLSVAVFLLAYHGLRLNLFRDFGRRLFVLENPTVLWRLMLAGIAIGVGSLLIYVNFDMFAFFEGLSGMNRRWTVALGRGRYGSWRTILYELQMFLQAALPLAICLVAMRRTPVFQRCIAALFIIWISVRTLFSGSRSGLIPIALCIAAALFWRAGPRLRRAMVYFGIPLALAGAFLLAAIIVAGRNQGQFEVSAAVNTDYVGFEMFRELLFIIRSEGEGLPKQYGLTYFTQIVNPIPRAIWPSKPVADAGLIMARAYGNVDRNGEPTMTSSPGFLGEAYLNFGFLGLLMVPAIAGVIVRAWDRLLSIAPTSLAAFLVYAAGLATICSSGRSFNMSSYYGLLALYVLLVMFDQLGMTARRVHVQRDYPAPFIGSYRRTMSRN